MPKQHQAEAACFRWVWRAKVNETGEHVRLGLRYGTRGPGLGSLQEVHNNLRESCSESIDGSLGFILFVVANTKDGVEWGGTPGLARGEVGKDELSQDLAKAIIGGEADEFVVLGWDQWQ